MQWRREGVCRPGQTSVSPPPGAVLGFVTGVEEEGLWGPFVLFLPSGVRGRAPAEIKFSAFYPQNIPSEESKLSDFVVFRST